MVVSDEQLRPEGVAWPGDGGRWASLSQTYRVELQEPFWPWVVQVDQDFFEG